MQSGDDGPLLLVIDDNWIRSQDGQKDSGAALESVRRLIFVTVGWLLASLATAILFAAVTAAIYALYHVKATPDLKRFYGAMGTLGFSTTLLVGALIRGRIVGHGSVGVGLSNEPISRLPAMAVLVLAVIAYAVTLNETIVGVRPDVVAKVSSIGPWLTAFAFLFVALLVGVLGPVSEELFFRGWLWTGLLQHWGVLPTATLTSAVWLVLHLEQGILRPVLLVPVAVLLAAARHFGRSVRAPLILHMLYNFTVMAPAFLK